MQLAHARMENLARLLLYTLLCFAAWSFCLPPAFAQAGPPLNFSDATEASRLQSIATQVLRLRLGAKPTLRSEGNMIGFRTDTVLVSRRLDSRTYLVQDLRTDAQKISPFKGTDQALLQDTRRIFTV